MNHWRKMSGDYWMCFIFDVWKDYGVRWASFYVGRRFEASFDSAKEAMRYCDKELSKG